MKKLVLLLALAACGDNHGTVAPADGPDADAPGDAAPLPPRAFVVAGDFTAGHPGVLSVLDMTTRTMMPNAGPAMAVGNDPVLRRAGDQLLVVNRTDNNVTILDARTLQLVEQLGTGAGSNPQDVAVLGSKLFVPVLGGKGIVTLTRGSSQITEIDLSADDPDGKPNCASVFVAGNDVYVACGLLDDTQQFLPPRGPGKVYVLDAATGDIKHTITLTTKNPIGLFEQIPAGAAHGGELVISTVDFASGEGCVEGVTTGATPAGAGCLVTNADVGNFVGRMDIAGDLMWLVVPSADFVHSNLRGFDLSTDALWPDPVNPTTEVIQDVAACPGGFVVVADSTMSASGLRVYEGTEERTTAALPVGLRPQAQHGLVCF